MRHHNHLYFVPCLKQKPNGNERVSIVAWTIVQCIHLLKWLGNSTDGMLDKLIVYTINRGAMTRSFLLLSRNKESLKRGHFFWQFGSAFEHDIGP